MRLVAEVLSEMRHPLKRWANEPKAMHRFMVNSPIIESAPLPIITDHEVYRY